MGWRTKNGIREFGKLFPWSFLVAVRLESRARCRAKYESDMRSLGLPDEHGRKGRTRLRFLSSTTRGGSVITPRRAAKERNLGQETRAPFHCIDLVVPTGIAVGMSDMSSASLRMEETEAP